MFKIGQEYTREQIHAALGGSTQWYLPTVSGVVVAACVTPEMNPRAPHVLLCGRGPIIEKSAHILSNQSDSVPVFVKRGVNRWDFRGNFKVKCAHSVGPTFDSLVKGSGRQPRDISLAIELT